MSDSKVTDTSSSGNLNDGPKFTGRVKWFNNKAGYGFITLVGDTPRPDGVEDDVFVHHTGIKVTTEQYKYLVQGEYVELTLRKTDGDEHPYQVANLTGLYKGKLMCETRFETRRTRTTEEGDQDGWTPRTQPRERRQRRAPLRRQSSGSEVRLRGTGPREGEVWTLTRNDEGEKRQDTRQRRYNRRPGRPGPPTDA